ncbi:MAG: type II toxin-antitoxin system VapC family toxin, partial [Terriglobales bacterium]
MDRAAAGPDGFMILVDTSVWIAHLRQANRELRGLLDRGEVLSHPMIQMELACGQIANRSRVLGFIALLPQ